MGFSLLEVLIASTVFSLGMAGLSALLLTNLNSSEHSRQDSVASVAAANLAAQIRLNPPAIVRYLNPPDTVGKDCRVSVTSSSGSGMSTGTLICTPQEQADYDFSMWKLQLKNQLPHAVGVVCLDASPDDGDVIDSQCDGGGTVVIKIFWASPRNTRNPAINKHRFSLVAG